MVMYLFDRRAQRCQLIKRVRLRVKGDGLGLRVKGEPLTPNLTPTVTPTLTLTLYLRLLHSWARVGEIRLSLKTTGNELKVRGAL